ncbi:MAG: class I SAM-dependent methyltransferase, partial [Psychroserpens sp.]|nr:class I SAM-dependent methyltransferase [Psychroserpens sp.]
IQIVAVNNEVKELLWLLRKGYDNDIRITAANIKKDSKDVFSFLRHHEAAAKIELSQPLTYLYEPNAAILKSGGFNSVATDLGLTKIHMHSHLYTSNQRVAFPGRCFKIETVYSFSKKEMKALTKSQANITTRNFPESVKDIRRKYKIKDGGSNYLFFTTDHQNNRIIIKCTKPN